MPFTGEVLRPFPVWEKGGKFLKLFVSDSLTLNGPNKICAYIYECNDIDFKNCVLFIEGPRKDWGSYLRKELEKNGFPTEHDNTISQRQI